MGGREGIKEGREKERRGREVRWEDERWRMREMDGGAASIRKGGWMLKVKGGM